MKILVVVDYQNDFINGSLGTSEAEYIYPRIASKITQDYDQIIYTQDTHFEDYMETQEGRNLPIWHCQKGTSGWEIPKDLLIPNAIVIEKTTFGSQELVDHIKQLNTSNLDIELIGVCTDICVVTNALLLKTAFPEANIHVDSKACAGLSPKKHQAALDVMASCQIQID